MLKTNQSYSIPAIKGIGKDEQSFDSIVGFIPTITGEQHRSTGKILLKKQPSPINGIYFFYPKNGRYVNLYETPGGLSFEEFKFDFSLEWRWQVKWLYYETFDGDEDWYSWMPYTLTDQRIYVYDGIESYELNNMPTGVLNIFDYTYYGFGSFDWIAEETENRIDIHGWEVTDFTYYAFDGFESNVNTNRITLDPYTETQQ